MTAAVAIGLLCALVIANAAILQTPGLGWFGYAVVLSLAVCAIAFLNAPKHDGDRS
jgi:hypothetical protein